MEDALTTRLHAWERELLAGIEDLLPTDSDTPRVDVHVHHGIDSGTGEELTLDEAHRQRAAAGVDRLVLIPLKSSDGYGTANDRLAELAADDPDRIDFLARVHPEQVEAANVERALDRGAAGIKLHPESDGADPTDARLRSSLELVGERNGVVLVHAGIDVDGTSEGVIQMARTVPDARFVLGHVAADSLAAVAKHTAELDNVSICTAWWGPVDLAWALSWSHPDRFVFGADPPFGSIPSSLSTITRVARAVGYDDAAMLALLGGNADRLLRGEPIPLRAGEGPDPDPSPQLLARLPAPWQRCYVTLSIAASLCEAGSRPTSQLQLAEAALEADVLDPAHVEEADFVRRSLQFVADLHEAGETRAAYIVATGALGVVATAPLLRDPAQSPSG